MAIIKAGQGSDTLTAAELENLSPNKRGSASAPTAPVVAEPAKSTPPALPVTPSGRMCLFPLPLCGFGGR